MSNSKECKFKIGDKVRVTECFHGHGFYIGEVVEILLVDEDYHCGNGSDYWYLRATEFELYEEKGTEMNLTNSMTAEQLRNEILRIETRIEEAKKDIENAEKERNYLVDKLREKGFELTDRAPTNSHSQKLSVGDIVRILSYNEEYHPENYTNQIAKIIKTDSSDRPYLVEVGGSEFWCTPEEVEKI